MNRPALISFYVAIAIVPSFCSWSEATIADKAIQGDDTTAAWILEPKQGRIFASVQSLNKVVEYDLEGKEVRRFSVGAMPTKMAIKGNFLCVICVKGKSVWTIDLVNNKKLSEVKLDAFPQNVFCSKVNNNLIYCACTKTESRGGFSIKQIDLSSNAIRNSMEVNRWGQSYPVNVAMSDDGKQIVPDGRGQTSPSGADLMRVDEKDFTFEQIKDYHDSFGQIVAGPSGRYWALGNKLYSSDLQDLNRSFNGQLLAFHPRLDLVAAAEDDKIELQSFSGAKSIASAVISAPSADHSSSKKKLSSSALRAKKREEQKLSSCLMFDESGQYLVYGRKTVCHILTLADLTIDAHDLLMISAPSSVATLAGQTIHIPINITNSKLKSATQFSLTKAPEGATLIDGKIIWTPSPSDIGNQVFTVQATARDQTDSMNVIVTVEAPKIELGFVPRGISFDLEGKYAFAWGHKMTAEEIRNGRHNSGEQSTDSVAVIDLSRRKILVSKTLAAGVQSAAISGEFVFLLTQSGSVFYRFELATLGKSQRRFLKGVPRKLFNHSKNEIAVMSANSPTGSLSIFDTESFKLTNTLPLGHESLSMNNHLQMNSRVAEDFIDHGSKIVNLNGATQVIKKNGNISLLSSINTRNRRREFPSNFLAHRSNASHRFGRRLNGNQLVNHSNSVVKSFQNSGSGLSQNQISPFAPVMFGLTEKSKDQRYDSDVSTVLEMRSLVDGSLIGSQTIDVRKRNSSNFRRDYTNLPAIRIFKEFVYVIRQTSLIAIPISKSKVKNAPMPLHFQIRKFNTLGVGKVEKIQVTAVGESSDLKYELLNEYPGIEINNSNGEISIDTPKMWKTYLENLSPNRVAAFSNANAIPYTNTSSKSPDESYLELMGKPLPKGKVPFVLPIDVAVSDEEGQEDRLYCYAMVLAPKGDLEKIEKSRIAELARRQKEMERDRAAQRALAQKRNNEMMKRREQGQLKKPDGENSRIDELEKRIRRIEAVLDAVLQKVEKLESANDK